MDLNQYKKAYDVYKAHGNVSQEQWNRLFELIFEEIRSIDPEKLMPEHLEIFKLTENYFASIEKYEKASAINQFTEAAKNIFKAREVIEKLKNEIANKNKN